jgi:hypothetical protein
MSEGQKCYNHHCGRVLVEEDFPSVMGEKPGMNFGKYHMCRTCWNLFDGQKMRGRFRMVGMGHGDLVRIAAMIDQAEPTRGCAFAVGHPSDESRYTESMDEWVKWQGERHGN